MPPPGRRSGERTLPLAETMAGCGPATGSPKGGEDVVGVGLSELRRRVLSPLRPTPPSEATRFPDASWPKNRTAWGKKKKKTRRAATLRGTAVGHPALPSLPEPDGALISTPDEAIRGVRVAVFPSLRGYGSASPADMGIGSRSLRFLPALRAVPAPHHQQLPTQSTIYLQSAPYK